MLTRLDRGREGRVGGVPAGRQAFDHRVVIRIDEVDERQGWGKASGRPRLNSMISLVRPITPETGLIRSEGIVLTCGRRIGTAEGRITDGDGRLLAHGTTTCLIFPT